MSWRPVPNQHSLREPGLLFGRLFDQPQGPAGRFEFSAERVLPRLYALRAPLATRYCANNGRPAEAPVLRLAVTILQFMEWLPDPQTAEECTDDLRWQLAVGQEVDAPRFHATSLVKFRRRLEEHGLSGLGLEGVLKVMRQADYLPRPSAPRLDSTHGVGLLSRMSRLECMRETVPLRRERLEQEPHLARPEAGPVWRERYVESRPDWQAPAGQLRLRLGQAGGDVQAAPERDGGLSAEALNVQVEERWAVCPAGHPSTQCNRLEEAKTGRVRFRFEWPGVCATRSLRGRCVGPDQPHRSLVVGEHHTLVQARRREQVTEAFQEAMHRRNAMEETISGLGRGVRTEVGTVPGAGEGRPAESVHGRGGQLSRLMAADGVGNAAGSGRGERGRRREPGDGLNGSGGGCQGRGSRGPRG